MFYFLKTTSLICFGEEEDKVAAEAKAAAEKTAEKKDEVFSQEQVNTFLADERRKNQAKQRELATELEHLKKNTALTTEERDGLQTRIEELQSQFLTTEEKARQEVEKKQKEFKIDVETLTVERDTWKEKHSHLLIDTAITKAASSGKNKAIQVEQIAAILIPKTKLSEKLDDDGRPTGDFEPRVRFDDTDKDDKPIILELTVNEAVKRMKELPQYGNLFEGDKKSGFGGTGSSATGKKIDIAKIAKSDPAAYRKLRKEQPDLWA